MGQRIPEETQCFPQSPVKIRLDIYNYVISVNFPSLHSDNAQCKIKKTTELNLNLKNQCTRRPEIPRKRAGLIMNACVFER